MLASCKLSHSVVPDSAIPWTAACQAPLSMGTRILEWINISFLQESCPDPGGMDDVVNSKQARMAGNSLPEETIV